MSNLQDTNVATYRTHARVQNKVVRFTTVSLLVKLATFEFATYIFVSLPIGKVQNLHPRRGTLKRTRNSILKDFFSRAIKGIFSVVYRK